MKNLITFLENHSVNYAFTSGVLLTVLIVAIICIIVLYLRLYEAKKSLKKNKFFGDISMQTIEDYETQIKEQEDHIKELKKSFEYAVAEVTELRSDKKIIGDELRIAYERIEAVNRGHKILIQDRDYWKERALHQKHTKKVVES